MLAVEHLAERAHGLGDRHVDARRAGELLGDVERLREEALDAARALHEHAVLVGELVDAEDGDDVLQLAVALQHLLDLVGDLEVLLADDLGLEDRRGRVERVDGRVDALLGDRARQRRRRVEVREHRGRRRVGEVVRRDVDGLDRGHRALAGRGDPLLQLAHLGLQRRLVAHLRRHAAQERGDLRAGLDEAEDVVDEEEHVLPLLVAEVLRHRQAGQRDAHARAGRLVHLAEHEHRLVDDARLGHLQPEVVALAGALAHAAEGRQAAVLLGEVVDELLDQRRLAGAIADVPAHGVVTERASARQRHVAHAPHLAARPGVAAGRQVEQPSGGALALTRLQHHLDLPRQIDVGAHPQRQPRGGAVPADHHRRRARVPPRAFPRRVGRGSVARAGGLGAHRAEHGHQRLDGRLDLLAAPAVIAAADAGPRRQGLEGHRAAGHRAPVPVAAAAHLTLRTWRRTEVASVPSAARPTVGDSTTCRSGDQADPEPGQQPISRITSGHSAITNEDPARASARTARSPRGSTSR